MTEYEAKSIAGADPGSQDVDPVQARLDALQYENDKLKSINRVLMQRVEMGWGNLSNAYSSFENAALLAEKVKQRTLKLRQTLDKLESTNVDLSKAKQESERARQRLLDTIESISDAIVLFDENRRLVMANSHFYEVWKNSNAPIVEGVTTVSDLVPMSIKYGIFDPKFGSTEKLVHRENHIADGVFRLTSGQWIQMSEQPTADGGLVVVYTNITQLKESENARRERALAEKNRILQSTLDNLSQGVALVGSEHQLEAWNGRFLELVGLDAQEVVPGCDFETLMADTELNAEVVTYCPDEPGGQRSIFESERTLGNGRVLEIKSHLIPGGAFVITYDDITERSLSEEALRESERRIRLITNAMPALISYINADLRYEFANRAFEEWFDRPREEIEGRLLWEVLGPGEYESHKEYAERALAGQVANFEVEQNLPNNRRRISYKTYVPHYDPERRVVGFFALEQDVTEQRRTAEALKHAYQHMEQRVYERTKELTRLNEQLRQEIEVREQAEAHLLDAKREAEEANLSKTRFLAAASHDLLQPMNAARLFATALLDHRLAPGVKKVAESLNYSLDNVESLLSTLVDISKLEAGVVEAIPDPFVANDLLVQLANEFRQLADSAQLDFRFVTSHRVVCSDSMLLARILRNFLSNAIRYTETGRILLGCRQRSDHLEIQVWDTGVGIPEDKLQEIFVEFNRIDGHNKRDDKGLGLGLAIVDKLSRVLDHTLKVRSWPGKGSVFSVLVPYGNLKSTKKEHARRKLPQMQDPLQGRRILVIDNDAAICAGMETVLKSWGCEVVAIQTLLQLTGEDGVLEPAPDLIIADYHLDGGATGIDAVDMLGDRLEQMPPVIMITADYSNELRQQVKALGFRVLNKPVKPLKLRSLMSHLLS